MVCAVRIEPVDVRDDPAYACWFDVAATVDADDRPGELHASLGERRGFALDALRPDAEQALALLVAVEGGRALGAASVELPRHDNLHLAEANVGVLPEARRRGVGSALLGEVERIATGAGRSTVAAEVVERPELLARSPGRAFAQRHGYALAQTEVRRDIDLPLAPARVARLEQECALYAAGYVVRSWRDRCPDELVEDMALLKRRMSTDAPVGDVDWREEEWDAARVRRHEELVGAQGRRFWGAGAVDEGTGRLVAFTEVGLERARPERAHQWETLVLGEHRGRRLGTLVKLACLGAVAAQSPTTRYVTTYNAEENAPMIRVNDALGARTNGTLSIWQRRLS